MPFLPSSSPLHCRQVIRNTLNICTQLHSRHSSALKGIVPGSVPGVIWSKCMSHTEPPQPCDQGQPERTNVPPVQNSCQLSNYNSSSCCLQLNEKPSAELKDNRHKIFLSYTLERHHTVRSDHVLVVMSFLNSVLPTRIVVALA